MNQIRYAKDLLIEYMAIHIVEGCTDEAILSNEHLFVTEETEEFARKHILKTLNDDQNFKCRELSANTIFSSEARKVIDNGADYFLDWSKEMANHMYNVIKNSDIPSCDVLCVQFITNETRCFGVLKLDYQLSHSHSIQFNESEQLEISLTSSESALPSTNQRVKKAVFFCKEPDEQIGILVLDKKQKIEDGNDNYFIEDFVECVTVSDNTDKTRKFKSTVEKWTQKNLRDKIEAANTVRSIVSETLLSDDKINMAELSDQMFSDVPEIKESFKESMGDAGYREDTEFEIDKTFVEKKMKTQSIKTDTGLTIKGEFDIFKDAQKYVERKNGDGTIDIVIKNVRNVLVK